jgi:uncharacterized repeat protein (TIGR03803 family)
MMKISTVVAVAVVLLSGGRAAPAAVRSGGGGTSVEDYAGGGGALFPIQAVGPSATIDVLHTFGTPGAYPTGGLVADAGGNLYGLTRAGGRWGFGTVYRCSPSGEVTTLHDFRAGQGVGRLCLASDGWIYGGIRNHTHHASALFRLSPTGIFEIIEPPSQETVERFRGSLVESSPGVFHGTTSAEASGGKGVLFRYSRESGFVVLHTFQSRFYSAEVTALTLAPDGKLYGTTGAGVSEADSGGTIYRYTPGGGMETLFSFPFDPESGTYPKGARPSSLVVAADGHLYGVTGPNGPGASAVFRYEVDGGFKVVAQAPENVRLGRNGLAEGQDGFLYGVASVAGERQTKLFRVSPAIGAIELIADVGEHAAEEFGSTLARVGHQIVGIDPIGPGRVAGRVFRYSTEDGLQIVHQFQGLQPFGPRTAFLAASDGKLYAAFESGGASGNGALMRLDPANGGLTVGHSFRALEEQGYLSFPQEVTEGPPGEFCIFSSGYSPRIDRVGGDRDSAITYPNPTESREPLIPPMSGGNGDLYTVTRTFEGNHTWSGWRIPAFLRVCRNSAEDLGSSFGTSFRPADCCPGEREAFMASPPMGELMGEESSSGWVFREASRNCTTSRPRPVDSPFLRSADGNFYGLMTEETKTHFYQLTPVRRADDPPNPQRTDPLRSDISLHGRQRSPVLCCRFSRHDNEWKVIRITRDGRFLEACSINRESVGYTPTALAAGADGRLYGLTQAEGPTGNGSIFRVTLRDLPPGVVGDLGYTRSGESVVVDVLANDYEYNGQQMVITSVSEPSRGQVRISGSTVVYTPSRKFRGEDSFSYSVSDGHGNIEVGTVQIRDPFVGQKGRFETRVFDGGGRLVGLLVMNLTSSGRATGVLTLGTRKIPFKGRFGVNGDLHVTLKKGRSLVGLSSLHLDFTSSAAVLTATVEEGDVLYSTTPVAAIAGKLPPGVGVSSHTVVFLGSPRGWPETVGWAIASTDSKGIVSIAGRLMDGASFEVAAPLQRNGWAALYVTSGESNASVLRGTLDLHPGSALEKRVALFWSIPGDNSGRSYQLEGFVERYAPSAMGVPLFHYTAPGSFRAVLYIQGNTFYEWLDLELSNTDTVKLAFPDQGELDLSIDRASGTFRGAFTRSGETESLVFDGVIDQNRNAGFGFGRKSGEVGPISFAPY